MASLTWDAQKFSNHEKTCKIAPKSQENGQNEISGFFAIFWCKNIIEIQKKICIPSQKVIGMTKIGGVLSLKKLSKIQFFTEKSEIALTYAEMTALSIDTISNSPMAAVGPPRSKMWPPYQVYFAAFNLVHDFEQMCSFARWR